MSIVQTLIGSFGGSSLPTQLTFIAVDDQQNTFSTNITASVPATAQSGDLAIMSFACDENLTLPFTVPSGWTLIHEATGALAAGGSFYKILESGDPGTNVVTSYTGSADDNVAAIAVFRPDNPITTVTVGSKNIEVTAGNPTQQTITASGVNVPVLLWGYCAERPGTTGGINPSGSLTTTGTDALLGDDNHEAYYHIYNQGDTPANLQWDMPDEQQNQLQSFYVSVE